MKSQNDSNCENAYIIETKDLSKAFKGFVAVSGVNLKVKRNTIHALIGPNGAGKTTCFNLLTKFISPTAGQILLNGHDITYEKPASVVRRGVGRSFQISAVFANLTVLENVKLALQRPQGLSYQFWKSGAVLKKLDERAMQLLDSVGIASLHNVIAGDLSYGRKRVLEIAATLALEPELLLLDEPMAGMGTEDIDRIAQLILQVSSGCTVLMVEHNLSVVADLSDTITVLKLGSILAEGSYKEISNNAEVIEAYMGVGHA